MKNIFICTVIFLFSCQSNESEKKERTEETGIANTSYDSIVNDDEKSHFKKDSLPGDNTMEAPAEPSTKNSNSSNRDKNDKSGQTTATARNNQNQSNPQENKKQPGTDTKSGNKQDGTGEHTTPANNGAYPDTKGVLNDTADENSNPGKNGKVRVDPAVKNAVQNYPQQKTNLSDTAAENITPQKKYRVNKKVNRKL